MKTEHKRNLLMVSHCVPHRGSSAPRHAAWLLLKRASGTRHIHLVALADMPVNLRWFRELSARTEQITLVPSGAFGGRRRMRSHIEQSIRRGEFDKVISTTPELWTVVEEVSASQGIQIEPWTEAGAPMIIRPEKLLRKAA